MKDFLQEIDRGLRVQGPIAKAFKIEQDTPLGVYPRISVLRVSFAAVLELIYHEEKQNAPLCMEYPVLPALPRSHL